MEPTPEFIDQLYVDKVLRARRIPPERKLFAPARLFEYTRGITIAGIRHQNPNASDEEVRQLFRQRLKLARQLEKHS